MGQVWLSWFFFDGLGDKHDRKFQSEFKLGLLAYYFLVKVWHFERMSHSCIFIKSEVLIFENIISTYEFDSVETGLYLIIDWLIGV